MTRQEEGTELEWIGCACTSVSDALLLRLERDTDGLPEMYLDGTWARPAPWWRRIRWALAYVFGFSGCKYINEFEHVFTEKSATRMVDVCRRYLRLRAEWRGSKERLP